MIALNNNCLQPIKKIKKKNDKNNNIFSIYEILRFFYEILKYEEKFQSIQKCEQNNLK